MCLLPADRPSLRERAAPPVVGPANCEVGVLAAGGMMGKIAPWGPGMKGVEGLGSGRHELSAGEE